MFESKLKRFDAGKKYRKRFVTHITLDSCEFIFQQQIEADIDNLLLRESFIGIFGCQRIFSIQSSAEFLREK